MAISMIETSHRLVGLLVAEAMNVDASVAANTVTDPDL
jgi:hypothetical protein